MNDKLKIKSLTKELIWGELTDKYPAGMKVFKSWLKKYKKENDWINLFYVPGNPFQAMAYNKLPIAMQLGIFMQFMHEQKINIEPVNYAFTPFKLDWLNLIRETIEAINNKNI